MTDWSEHHPRFHKLLEFLSRIPGVEINDAPSRGFGSGLDDGTWWVKFSIAIDHPLAWNVVQELGCVLNQLSLTERLPTVFKPVSPPPYLNGGPRDFLSWVVECNEKAMKPGTVADWLEARLPRPVESEDGWPADG
ncbi:MAG TPA: hypothetical protein VFS49_08345 [Croceibacterium sp.]|nr:hypothetical protein [Croceibacterium sp.]